jgi:putative redox protein
MPEVTVRWNGERRFVAADEHGHSLVMDSPSAGYIGMRPMELVLAGLAGCTGMDVISILEKKREHVTGLTVRVLGVQRDEYPTRWQTVHVEYEFTGRALKPASLERAIELSEEKYCAVRGSLAPEIRLTSSYHLLEESTSEE